MRTQEQIFEQKMFHCSLHLGNSKDFLRVVSQEWKMQIKYVFLIINHNITVGKFGVTEGSHLPDGLTSQNGPVEDPPASFFSLTETEQVVSVR